MGRKITLFRFDVELGDDDDGAGRSAGDHRVTVERTEEFDAAADDEDEDGGSLVRKLLVTVVLLAVGAVGGFVLRGKVAGREIARSVKSKLPVVGGSDGPEDEPTYPERGASTLVGFGFLVSLTVLSKRLYGTGPLDDPSIE